jgi:hypothetical protein
MEQNCDFQFCCNHFSYFVIADDCSCRNFVDSAGFGNCELSNHNGPLCYVNEPSSCTDLVTVVEGEQYSNEACAKISGNIYVHPKSIA